MNFIIKNTNNVQIASAKKLEYNGEWMGERSVTLTIQSPTTIPFTIGCYVEYRGERFVLNNIPSSKKQGASGAYGESFVYENVKFDSLSDELVRCHFDDTVINDNTIHYTYLPSFDFYASNVKALATRIQANLNRLYTGASAWNILVDVGVYNNKRAYYSCLNNNHCDIDGNVISASIVESIGGKTNVAINISNNTCWDGLAMVYSQFGVNFFVSKTGRKIIIGSPNKPMSSYGSMASTFKFGKGYGLRSINRTIDDNQAVVTRLRAFGNTTNMPPHYYNKFTTITGVAIDSVEDATAGTRADKVTLLHLNIDPADNTFPAWLDRLSSTYGTPEYSMSSIVTMVIGNYLFAGQYCVNGWSGVDYWITEPCWKITAIDTTRLVVGAGISKFPSGLKEYQLPSQYKVSTLDGNISVQNLMMHPFPSDSVEDFLAANPSYRQTGITGSTTDTDPYVDSDVKATLGIREATMVFDGSGDNIEDIYPSIEGVKYNDIHGGTNTDPVDELKGVTPVTDDGIFADGAKVPPFTITVYNLGFNLKDVTTSGTSDNLGTISFKDGMLGGREFTILSETTSGNYKVWTCERVKDTATGYYYPNSSYNAAVGDKFVLLNIFMPDIYITAASKRLLTAAQIYLLANNATHFQYEPAIDNIFMARQHDNYVAGIDATSYHDNIMEGDSMTMEDADLFGANNVTMPIATLNIKEQEGRIPQYTISLDDKKASTFIERIKQSINTQAIVNTSVTGGGISIEESIKAGEQRFLSKLNNDTAAGRITFNKGIVASDDGSNKSFHGQSIYGTDININGDSSINGTQIVGSNQSVGGNQSVNGNLAVNGTTTHNNETKSLNASVHYDNVDLTDSGWGINKQGQISCKSMVIRDYLAVPELRYNRISVQAGMTWLAPGAGKIKECWYKSANTGYVIKLDLEDGEYGSFCKGDLVIGIYHTGTNRDSDTTEDNLCTSNSSVKVKGFMTCYFVVEHVYTQGQTFVGSNNETITASGNAQYFRISFRTGYQYNIPRANMSIVGIGNQVCGLPSSSTESEWIIQTNGILPSGYEWKRPTRQNSLYATTNYFRFLRGVKSWDMSTALAMECDNTGAIVAHNAGSIKITSDNVANGYWQITQGAIQHSTTGLRLSADGKLYDPDGLSIKIGSSQSTIVDIQNDVAALGDDVEDISTDVEGLKDGQFLVWQSSNNAPTSSGNIVEWIDYDDETISASWTATERADHVNDFLIYSDGVTYKFVHDTTKVSPQQQYGWQIVTDKYLIDTINGLNSVKNGLAETGIDLLNRKILVTGDTFEVQNNNRERTFMVGERGDISVMGAINYSWLTIDADNYQDYYFQVQNGANLNLKYIPQCIILDESLENITISGGSSFLSLPITMPHVYATINSVTLEPIWHTNYTTIREVNGSVYTDREMDIFDLRSFIGRKFIIMNNTGVDILFNAYGTGNDSEEPHTPSSDMYLPEGKITILECCLFTDAWTEQTPNEYEKIYWKIRKGGVMNQETRVSNGS